MGALTDLQLAVMKALWSLGSGSVADVQAALASEGRELAVTTISTLLRRLDEQGWVRHSKTGRQFIYHPQVLEKEAAKSALRRVVDHFFDGRVASVTAELLDSEDVTEGELDEIRRLLAEKER